MVKKILALFLLCICYGLTSETYNSYLAKAMIDESTVHMVEMVTDEVLKGTMSYNKHLSIIAKLDYWKLFSDGSLNNCNQEDVKSDCIWRLIRLEAIFKHFEIQSKLYGLEFDDTFFKQWKKAVINGIDVGETFFDNWDKLS